MPSTSDIQVFINVPFDRAYTPLLHALICSLVCVRRRPRTSLEIPESDKYRLEKIWGLLNKCRYSIHDLSRMSGKGGLPRMNMPFELGLAYAISKQFKSRGTKSKPHGFFMLEREKHRIQKTLSDLNGHEPHIHHNKPQELIRIIVEWFSAATSLRHRSQLAKPYQILEVFDAFRLKLPKLRRDYCGPPSFDQLVVTATIIAQAKGYV